MKYFLLCGFLLLQSLGFTQLVFDTLSSPADFNMVSVRKSPIGEYFVQAANDPLYIYNSLNGQDWIKSRLPVPHVLYDVQFFSDGTPVLKPEEGLHVIRRGDTWYAMDPIVQHGWVEASFIKEDTLFVFENKTFLYSLDKGESFTSVFTFAESIVDHTAHLWVLNNHFVLLHTNVSTYHLSIITREGVRIFYQSLATDNFKYTPVYNDCGQVLFVGSDNYYLLEEAELTFSSGVLSDIIPEFSPYENPISQNGQYYYRSENTVYKTNGCNFIWEPLISDPLIQSNDEIWITAQEDILLYDDRSDFFIEQESGSSTWKEIRPEINYPFIYSVDEYVDQQPITLTPNALFIKTDLAPDWIEIDSSSGYNQVSYSPGGDLYVYSKTHIDYSTDNGDTFMRIPHPETKMPFMLFKLEVLADGILFAFGGTAAECFYTVNNGHEWRLASLPIFYRFPSIRLVDNTIVIAQFWLQQSIIKINLGTGEMDTEYLDGLITWDPYPSTIMEDGTIFFMGREATGGGPEGLFKYHPNGELEFLGPINESSFVSSLFSSGANVYGFGPIKYSLINGETIETYDYIGLPGGGTKEFILSENQYLYVIYNQNIIYRSTTPLSYPQFITGAVYHDTNQDCESDTLDPKLRFWQVRVENAEFLRVNNTNTNGEFSISVPKGDFTLSTQPLNANWDLCTSSYPVTVNDTIPNVTQDFLAKGLSSCAALEIDFSTPLLRRCFDNYYSIRIRNTGPEPTDGTTLSLKLDPFFAFLDATVPFTLSGDSIVVFELGALAVNDERTFRIYFTLSCTAFWGMEHCLRGVLTDDNICGDVPLQNMECQKNIGSFDPNDKRTFNEDGVESDTVNKGAYIYYHIRFQNTGTDTAFTIKIIDSLSSILDVRTLEMLSASHPYVYYISDGPALVVLFDKILLPDSSINEPASHGYFKFRIKPLPEYDYGTSISNQADIYFDFNDPVATNQANVTIQYPVGTKEVEKALAFNLFPNPTSGLLFLEMHESDLARIEEYSILDPLGRHILPSAVLSRQQIDVRQLTPGVYFLLLKENNIIVGTKKFIRM